MSGPKVVNVQALRLQQQRRALALFAELNQEIAEWRRQHERAGSWSVEIGDVMATTLKTIEALQARQNWPTLITKTQAHLSYFRNEAEKARAAYEAKLKRARDRRRSVQLLARSLLRQNTQFASELDGIVRQVESADDRQLASIEKMLEQVLIAVEPSSATPSVKAPLPLDVTTALGSDSGPPTTLVEWQKTFAPDDPNLIRLDAMLADLATWGTREDCGQIESKAQAAREDVTELRCRQLVDSIQFEIADLKRQHREQLVAQARVRAVEARLAQLAQPEASKFIEQLASITVSSDPTQMLSSAAAAEAWCDKEEKLEEAYARREAVLGALRELGYDVREDMTAAWAHDGRIVIARRDRPQAGVELEAAVLGDQPPAEDVNISMRPVGLGPAGGSVLPKSEGIALEQAWCNDFAKWQDIVEKAGFTPNTKIAVPVGRESVKVLSMPSPRQAQPPAARRPAPPRKTMQSKS